MSSGSHVQPPPRGPDEGHQRRVAELGALLSRVALADRTAFEALYRATSALLFGVVLRINHERSLAEEVLQDVFVTVWRQAASFNSSQGEPMAWLTSIARNRAIDSLRRKASQPATISRFQGPTDGGTSPDAEEDLLAAIPSEAPGPLELLDDASRAHALERCISTLSGEQRNCLALAYYQGLSHTEVAEHVRQPLGTVKSWVRRGLLSLRECLDRASGLVVSKARAA